MCKAKDTQRTD